MAYSEIVTKLKTLSKTEASILFLKCGGMDYEDIGIRIHYEIPTVQLYASSMYQKLGFDKKMHPNQRKEILKKDYCPVITELYDLETGWVPDDPEPNPSIRALMVVQQEYKEEQEHRLAKRPPVVIIDPNVIYPLDPNGPPGSEEPSRRWVLYLIIGILLLSVLFLLKDRFFPATPAAVPTLISTSTGEVPAIIPTNTLEPSLTPSITPSQTPTQTPIPTITPIPTVAPLLENKFIDGISPAWTVLGNPVIMDGALTSDGTKPVTLIAGDSSWVNYEMFVSFTLLDTGMCDQFIGVRINDNGEGMWLGVVRAGRLGWFKGPRGYSGWFNNNEALITEINPTLQIIVKDNTFRWVGGNSVTLEGYPSGGVQIFITCDKIDYIRINQLP